MTEAWRYGDAGDRWPVAVGDIWRVGPHVLACGDVERGSAEEVVTVAGAPSLIYTDPPRIPALTTGFRTKAGVPRPVDFKRLMGRAMSVARVMSAPTLVETGGSCVDLLMELARDYGALVHKWPITYFKTKPGWLLQLGWGAHTAPITDFTDVDDEYTPATAIREATRSGDLVLDLFAGRGLTC